jgi:hypothetical protein
MYRNISSGENPGPSGRIDLFPLIPLFCAHVCGAGGRGALIHVATTTPAVKQSGSQVKIGVDEDG